MSKNYFARPDVQDVATGLIDSAMKLREVQTKGDPQKEFSQVTCVTSFLSFVEGKVETEKNFFDNEDKMKTAVAALYATCVAELLFDSYQNEKLLPLDFIKDGGDEIEHIMRATIDVVRCNIGYASGSFSLATREITEKHLYAFHPFLPKTSEPQLSNEEVFKLGLAFGESVKAGESESLVNKQLETLEPMPEYFLKTLMVVIYGVLLRRLGIEVETVPKKSFTEKYKGLFT